MSEGAKELETFDDARRSAFIRDILGFFQKRPVDLLRFEEIKERLHLKQLTDRGVQEVPLDRIIGTVGRENEFNRLFLPRDESLRKRWQEIKDLAEGSAGFPPVELYYVKDVFFVVDGHHRVSVARAVGATSIEARVKEFSSPVILGPNASMENVILNTGLVNFLETTGLKQTEPDEYVMTIANGYEKLLDHICGHRYYRGIKKGEEVTYTDAVRSWRRSVYRPMIRIIRKHKVLEQFPGHTETDLYLFTMEHLHYLREQYAPRDVGRVRAIQSFTEQMKPEKKWW